MFKHLSAQIRLCEMSAGDLMQLLWFWIAHVVLCTHWVAETPFRAKELFIFSGRKFSRKKRLQKTTLEGREREEKWFEKWILSFLLKVDLQHLADVSIGDCLCLALMLLIFSCRYYGKERDLPSLLHVTANPCSLPPGWDSYRVLYMFFTGYFSQLSVGWLDWWASCVLPCSFIVKVITSTKWGQAKRKCHLAPRCVACS